MTPGLDRAVRLLALRAQVREYGTDPRLLAGRERAETKAFRVRLRLVSEADLEREERGRRVWYRQRAAEARALESRLGPAWGETAGAY